MFHKSMKQLTEHNNFQVLWKLLGAMRSFIREPNPSLTRSLGSSPEVVTFKMGLEVGMGVIVVKGVDD